MTTTQLDKEDVFKRIIDKATASTSIALQYILTTRRSEKNGTIGRKYLCKVRAKA